MRRLPVWGLTVAVVVACGELFAPPLSTATLSVVPVYEDVAVLLDNAFQLRIVVERESEGTFEEVTTVTVALDPETGEASAEINVVLLQSPEKFRIGLRVERVSDGAVLFEGFDFVEVTEQTTDEPSAVEIEVTYVYLPAASIEIDPKEATLLEGATLQFTTVTRDADGNEIDVPVGFALANPEHESILDVNRLSGEATALQAIAETPVFVVASTKDEVPVEDTARVYVCSPTVVGPVRFLEVSPTTHTFTLLGEELQLVATGQDLCNNQIPDPDVDWSSSASDVLPVSAAGVARARDNGAATATATLTADASVSATTGDLTVQIPEGSLQGIVRRQEDSSPVAGVELVLTDVFGRERRATTGADGAYLFTNVLAGPNYTLDVNAATLPPITVLVSDQGRTVEIVGDATSDAPETLIRKANIPIFTQVSATSVTVGGEIEVTLFADMSEVAPALGALTAAITWSDAVLRYVAGSFEAVASWDGIIENPAVPGQLTLVAVSTNGVADDVVTVARFRLRANAAGSTTVMPVATELGTIDSDGVSYDLLQLGNVTFAGSDVVSN